jgi:phage/plasmid primase-like uncharacterized protein
LKLDFKATLNVIKSKITFNQVLESWGVKTSSSKMICCPLHIEDTPSFKIYDGDTGEGNFFCFGCLKGGDMLSFVEYLESISKGAALNKLATRFNIDLETREYTNNLLGTIESMLNPKLVKKRLEIGDFLITAANCNQLFSSLTEEKLTPYMVKKNVPHIGTKSRGSDLVVPVCDVDDNIWSLQFIKSDGRKMFQDDSRRKGCMYRLGRHPRASEIVYLAEGYSTGASVFLSTGVTTYVCFSSGNIAFVHEALLDRFPGIHPIVAGDNDASGRLHGLPGVYPEKEGQDWNDVWLECGKGTVGLQLATFPIVAGGSALLNEAANILKRDRR